MNEYVKSDAVRYGAIPTFRGVASEYLRNKTFRWQVAFRLVNSTGIEKLIGAILWKTNRNRQNIQIHRRATVDTAYILGTTVPLS